MINKRRSGFTLIELLVVIAIIALLLAIIMPALHKVKEIAGLVICGSNQRQVANAVSGFTAENDGKFPLATSVTGRPCVLYRGQDKAKDRANGATSPKVSAAYYSLGSYLPSPEIFNCPQSSFAQYDNVQVDGTLYSYQDLYQNPYPNTSYNQDCSYQLLWNYTAFQPITVGTSTKEFKGPGAVKSDTRLLLCEAMFYSNSLSSSGGILQNHWASPHRFKGSFKNSEDQYPYYYYQGVRDDLETETAFKNVKLNAAYSDGRVERYTAAETYYDLCLFELCQSADSQNMVLILHEKLREPLLF